MSIYLVTVYWTSRPVTNHYEEAESNMLALYKAVGKHCLSDDELYDHTKSKAVEL